MKDKLEPLTLITNVNSEFSKPKLCFNYTCQICETKHSEEILFGIPAYQAKLICENCANAIRELIKTK